MALAFKWAQIYHELLTQRIELPHPSGFELGYPQFWKGILNVKTRVTELLGIEVPIIQGAMARIADASLAGAVSEAGGLGIIACGGAPLDWVRDQVEAARKIKIGRAHV